MPNQFKVKNGLVIDQGGAVITGSIATSGSVSIVSSGSSVFTVDGTSGRLFSIDDSLSGSLHSVNTAAGLPVLEVFSDNTTRIGKYGAKALFVSQSKVGIGKEADLIGILDVSGSTTITGSLSVTNGITGAIAATNGIVSGASQVVSILTSINTYTASVDTKFTTLASVTGSLNSFTASIISLTGSFATTGSNTFRGTQIISGSTYITGDLVVLGSSSITNVSSSVINIGTNTVVLNTYSPAVRFGGISVIDSGSGAQTGSLFWDSLNNKWIYSNPSGVGYSGGRLMSGPQNTGTLGNEVGLTTGRIIVAQSDDHISGSQASDDGLTFTIPNSASIGHLVGIGVPSTFSSSVYSSILNLNSTSASQQSNIVSLGSLTGSYATTGSNRFISNQIVSGTFEVDGGSSQYPVTIKSQNTNNTWMTFYNNSTSGVNAAAGIRLNIYENGIENIHTQMYAPRSGNAFTSGAVVIDNLMYGLQLLSRTGDISFMTIGYGYQTPSYYRLQIKNNGNVIVGDSTDYGFKTDINGTLRVRDNVYVTGSVVFTGNLNASAITGAIAATNGVVSGSSQVVGILTSLNSYTASADTKFTTLQNITASLISKTGSYATTGSNSFIGNQSINGNIFITGGVIIGSASISTENTLILGVPVAGGTGEGGQILLAASGGLYTSASMFDNWQNFTRLLRGSNQSSDAVVTQWNMHTKQVSFPAYNSVSAFAGTAVANLAVDSGGNILTVSTSGGSVFPYTGTAVINGGLTVTGSITSSGVIYAQPNGGMYFQGGDDAALYDINISNHMGIYGVQDSTVASIKLGSGGGIISGKNGNIGIATTDPTSGTLHVNGNIFATSLTGSIAATNGVVSGSSQVVGILSSLNSYTASANNRFSNLESTTSSLNNNVVNLNTFTASANNRFTNLELTSASVNNSIQQLNTFTASNANTSLNTYTASVASSITNLNSYSASVSNSIAFINTSTASLNSFTASAGIRLSNLESTTASLLIETSNLELYTASVTTKFATLASVTASLNTFTASFNAVSASFATTGSNTFRGTQIISGSTYITGDLIVIGSSSIANISSSVLSVGTNVILLNTYSPAVRFGGISVIDSGSSAQTGSLLWDSLNNKWIYSNPSAVGYSGGRLISGPQNTGAVGSEVGLTSGRITVAVGDDHISGSQASDDGLTFTIPNSASIGFIVGLGVPSTFSASVANDLNNLEAKSASVDISLSNLNIFTASAGLRLTNLESKSASVDISLSNLNAFTASENTKATTLQSITSSLISKTGSYATTGSNTFNGEQSITGSVTISGSTRIDTSLYIDPTKAYTNYNSLFTLNQSASLSATDYYSIARIQGTGHAVQYLDMGLNYYYGYIKYGSGLRIMNALNSSSILITGNVPSAGGIDITGDGSTDSKIDLKGGIAGNGWKLIAPRGIWSYQHTSFPFQPIKFNGTGTDQGIVLQTYSVSDAVTLWGTTGNFSVGYLTDNGYKADISGSTRISNGLTLTGSFSASLQQGYAWVGNASGVSTAVATSSFAGSSGLKTKAGSVANSSFTGTPRKATVTFSTGFSDTNYSIVITGEDARTWTVESKAAGTFVINSNSNFALSGTTYWQAIAYGETV